MQHSAIAALFMPFLPDDPAVPQYLRLFRAFQQAIVQGQLPLGSKLPASRPLCQALGISRNTVKSAYEILQAEGYIETRQGSGSYVSSRLPDQAPLVPERARTFAAESRPPQVSAFSRHMLSLAPGQRSSPDALLSPVRPCLQSFPWREWQSAAASAGRQMRQSQPHCDLGLPRLRELIAEHLRITRGTRCAPEQVVICSGSQQALYLSMRLLVDPGDAVLVEAPGYQGVDGAIEACGGRRIPVLADTEGFDVAQAIERAPSARLALVTPSRNYPMGYTLSLQRRLSLLQWAKRCGAWIIEDDYDSEFRFDGPPLTALQGLGGERHVVYMGTFSRVLHPSIRLGYVLMPEALLESCEAIRRYQDGGLSLLPQLALAEFMQRGHYASHVRRMRALYKSRRDALAHCIAEDFAGRLQRVPSDGGMHSVFRLLVPIDDVALCARASAQGLGVRALSAYYPHGQGDAGLVMGFAAHSEAVLQQALRRLQRVW